jgi:predicted methyltransferase
MSEETVLIADDSIRIFGLIITIEHLKRIIKRDSVLFAIDQDGPFPLEIRDRGYAKLVPPADGLGPPTFELSGIKMHRSLGIDPFRDAKIKVEAVVKRGDYVLDTCGGLGYTATWARRNGAAEVISCEKNPDVISLRRYNPWSHEYLRDGRIEKIENDVVDVLKEFEDGHFDSIIHDPPRFSLAGELYGEKFIRDLNRILSAGGRIVFYTGEPYRAGRGRNFIAGVEKRLRKARFAGSYHKELMAITAEKK